MRIIFLSVLSSVVIAGCASGPKEAPKPDMTNMIKVNNSVPYELRKDRSYQPSGHNMSDKNKKEEDQ